VDRVPHSRLHLRLIERGWTPGSRSGEPKIDFLPPGRNRAGGVLPRTAGNRFPGGELRHHEATRQLHGPAPPEHSGTQRAERDDRQECTSQDGALDPRLNALGAEHRGVLAEVPDVRQQEAATGA
jgi:hypothetical protein